MRDEDRGAVEVLGDAREPVLQIATDRGVEGAERLVQQQQAGRIDTARITATRCA
ncbi:hypothetical protein GS883_20170 [Rhodococcus hoagii]|nr:hypothetical protein [Prescottella equi]